MFDGVFSTPSPRNEPVLSYAPGTPERTTLKNALREVAAENRELCSVINGQNVKGSGEKFTVRPPHQHRETIGTVLGGTTKDVASAVNAACVAKDAWCSTPFRERAAIFLRAADILAAGMRARSNAATMLGQSKTSHQAEIDAACELIDFWRFNVAFATRLYSDQPLSPAGQWNQMDYRPLDGFVVAITPFNFTSIAGNLPTAPALMGNTVVWKPASTAALSAQFIMDVLQQAGLPKGVINLVHARGAAISEVALSHSDLGGIHFTGSTETFHQLWGTVAKNLSRYRSYPRLVGETGGKDFIFAHASADPEALAVAICRGAFEYQGQKCSAASRAYIPKSLWKKVTDRLAADVHALKVGDVSDFGNFMGAVIDESSFDRIVGYIESVRSGPGAKILLGGTYDKKEGYFIQPTVVVAEDPKHRLMCEEIFGPVVTLHPYNDEAFSETLELCDSTSPYALTGAIFANDRAAVQLASDKLRFSAGNFYINDKPTGAVVGQQPFGGGRASGTNDKAGSMLNLVRWVNARTIKETFDPPRGVPYPFMQSEK